MIRLELPVRWEEQNKDVEKYGDMLKSTDKKYSYGKLSIDAGDIGPYYDMDDRHTMVNDKLGKVYCIAVPFNEFKRILTETTGQAILSIQTTEEYISNKPKRNKNDDKKNPNKDDLDINDILDE